MRMNLKRKEKVSVTCIQDVFMKEEDLEVFTKGETYDLFSSYSKHEILHDLVAIDNYQDEHIISRATKDEMSEYLKDEWFIKHFKVVPK